MPLDAAVLVAVVLAAAFGALERIWLLFHLPLFGDEAVVGLMTRQIGQGHVSAFYWGQQYGGVEPYVAALLGQVVAGPIGLNATAALLSGAAAVLVGLVVADITGDRRTGLLAGALAWVWPYALVWNSSRELGFHFATLTLGLGLFYLAVRLSHGHRSPMTLVAFGICAGAGWWSSPEIVYFAVPAGALLVGSWRRWTDGWRVRVDSWPPVLVGAGTVLGALPWLIANVRTGFASLSPASAPTGSTSYAGRLVIFFDKVLPTELGLKTLFAGNWVGGRFVGGLLFCAALVVLGGCIVLGAGALRRGRGGVPLFACAAGVAAFPFLMAADPGAGYWLDGRYGVDLSFLIVALAFSVLVESGAARVRSHRHLGGVAGPGDPSATAPRSAARLVAGIGMAVVAGGAALTAVGAHDASGTPDTSAIAFVSGWHNPNAVIEEVARSMEAAGIRHAYGDYWTSYTLDYVDPALTVSPSPMDPVRSSSIAGAVAGAGRPAWLFFAPGHETAAARAFANPEPGAANYSEGAFLALLARRGVGYKVVNLGVLDAVIPDRPVTLP